MRNLAHYLASEAQDKLKISLDYDLITKVAGQKNVRVSFCALYSRAELTPPRSQVPLQDNFSDCGLYILHYVEQLLTNPQEMLDHIAVSFIGDDFRFLS